MPLHILQYPRKFRGIHYGLQLTKIRSVMFIQNFSYLNDDEDFVGRSATFSILQVAV